MQTAINIDSDAIYTTNAASRLIGVSSDAISKARRRGEIHGVRRGMHWYFRGSALIEWLTSDSKSQEDDGNT
jgi:hypothetical protein